MKGLICLVIGLVSISCSQDDSVFRCRDTRPYFADRADELTGHWQLVLSDSLSQVQDTFFVTIITRTSHLAKPACSIRAQLSFFGNPSDSSLVDPFGAEGEKVEQYHGNGHFIDDSIIHMALSRRQESHGWNYKGELTRIEAQMWQGAYSFAWNDFAAKEERRSAGLWQITKLASLQESFF